MPLEALEHYCELPEPGPVGDWYECGQCGQYWRVVEYVFPDWRFRYWRPGWPKTDRWWGIGPPRFASCP